MENYTEHLAWLYRMNPMERAFTFVQHFTEDGDPTEIFRIVHFDQSLNSNEITILKQEEGLTEDDIRGHFIKHKVSFL